MKYGYNNNNTYGAFELKAIYVKNYSFGILTAIALHLLLFLIINSILKEDTVTSSKVKYEIINYVELGPPPSIIENKVQNIIASSKPTFGNLKVAKKGEEESEFEIPKSSNQIGDVKVEESKPIEKKIEPVDETYYVSVDIMPEPLGGMDKINRNVNYPEEAKRNSIIGKVFVKAYINEIGEVTRAEIVKGLGYGCDEEAIWIIKNTRFKAGKKNGKPVKVQIVIPVTFRP